MKLSYMCTCLVIGGITHTKNHQFVVEMPVDLRKVKLAWQGFDEEMSDEAYQASDIQSFLLAALRKNQGPYA